MTQGQLGDAIFVGDHFAKCRDLPGTVQVLERLKGVDLNILMRRARCDRENRAAITQSCVALKGDGGGPRLQPSRVWG